MEVVPDEALLQWEAREIGEAANFVGKDQVHKEPL